MTTRGLKALTAVGTASLAAAALIAPTTADASSRDADTVLLNGYIYTVDSDNSVKKAMAVDDGRIIYVGSNRGARALIGSSTDVIDLDGKMVMPGIQDGHTHTLAGGSALVGCNLHYAPLTVAEFQDNVQSCLDDTADGEPDKWLAVDGWYVQAMLPAGTTLTKADLDVLDTQRPILVSSTDGHTALANSRALELAGIDASTPDPVSGAIEHLPGGEPSGILQDGAQGLVRDLIPPPTAEDNLVAAQAAIDALNAQGVTSFQDAIAGPDDMEAFSTMADNGNLTARAHLASLVSVEDASDPSGIVANLDAIRTQYDDGRLTAKPSITVRNAKFILDGVVQAPAQTAAMLRPYLENVGTEANPEWVPSDHSGSLYWPERKLARVLKAVTKAGWDPHIHAIGDAAVREALDATAAVRDTAWGNKPRISFAHTEVVSKADFDRFAELNVPTAMGFQWAKPAPDSIEAAQPFLGPKRFSRYEPEGDLYRHDARISLGSDWPVDPLDEWFSLKVVITREAAPDSPYASYGPMTPEQALPRVAAIRAMTINGAYQLHQAKQTGSLEVGKFADYIVLDRNIMTIDAADIANTNVLATVVGGDTVYGTLD
jgi:predicted amidohydrolase YtcJ